MNAMNRQVPSGEHRHPGLAFDTAHATESEPAVLTLNEVARDLHLQHNRRSRSRTCSSCSDPPRSSNPSAAFHSRRVENPMRTGSLKCCARGIAIR